MEETLIQPLQIMNGSIIEFSVAAKIKTRGGELPYREMFKWIREIKPDLNEYTRHLAQHMQAQNI